MKLQYFGHLMWTDNSLESFWCWERPREEGEKGVREWDSWMASPIKWTWTWANPGDGEGQGGWHAVVHVVAMSRTQMGHWTMTTINTKVVPLTTLIHCFPTLWKPLTEGIFLRLPSKVKYLTWGYHRPDQWFFLPSKSFTLPPSNFPPSPSHTWLRGIENGTIFTVTILPPSIKITNTQILDN